MNYYKDSNGDHEKNNKEIVLNPLNNSGLKINDIICFAHLRWNLVFQRPQHLLSRWTKEARVFYFEEPIIEPISENHLDIVISREFKNLFIITPRIKEGLSEKEINYYLEECIDNIISLNNIKDYMLWYLTPMSLPFSKHLAPRIVVYDCMDELSCFKGAHPQMATNEAMLLKYADTVFTGGYSLYEYKKHSHFNIHPFPSSIDKSHFESGYKSKEPADQINIQYPRAGFFGVIDERMDIDLLDGLARTMPDFQFIMIGPVVKIERSLLPDHKNIHYLGPKKYAELPSYLAYWDIAFLPFAKNESTRFISPTKTPEYLCAGKPVVSTSIQDVKDPYGKLKLVSIADTVDEFSMAIRNALVQRNNEIWKTKVREFLKSDSWDNTFFKMKKIIYETLEKKEALNGKLKKVVTGKLNNNIESTFEVKIKVR